jgi:hypothetical protein
MAQFSTSQLTSTPKFARTLLRRLTESLLSTDPPHLVYATLLATIAQFAPSASPTPASQSLQDTHAALTAVDDLRDRAVRNAHPRIVLLGHVLRLRILVVAGMWEPVPAVLREAEDMLGLTFSTSAAPDTVLSRQQSTASEDTQIGPSVTFDDAFDAFMAIHILIFGVVFHTQSGNAAESSVRLRHLHALLDAGVLQKAPHGIVNVRHPHL